MLVLCAAALVAALALAFGGTLLGNSVLFHAAISLGLSTGVLVGVVRSQMARTDARAASAAAPSHDVAETDATPLLEMSDSSSSTEDVVSSAAHDEPSHLRRLLALPSKLKALRPIRHKAAGSGFDMYRVALVGLAVFGMLLIFVSGAARVGAGARF